jgi:hypothetical protein
MFVKVVTFLSSAIVVNIHQIGHDYILNYEYLKCYKISLHLHIYE